MSDFLERMNEISRRQGKAPIDPTYIEGSGAPWPGMPPTEIDPGGEDPPWKDGGPWADEEPRMTTVPASAGPTVVHETRGEEPEVAPSSPPAQQRNAGDADVVVWDTQASFKGTAVKLNDDDLRMIVHVILNAAHRTLRGQMEQFGVAPARRRRKKTAPVVAEVKPVVVKKGKRRQRLDGSII